MGVMNTARALGGNIQLISKLVPEVTRMINKRSKEEVAIALESDEGMTDFAKTLYAELGVSMRNQIPESGFISVILRDRKKLMSKKRNIKKVKERKK